jgi:hypothetical protein
LPQRLRLVQSGQERYQNDPIELHSEVPYIFPDVEVQNQPQKLRLVRITSERITKDDRKHTIRPTNLTIRRNIRSFLQ